MPIFEPIFIHCPEKHTKKFGQLKINPYLCIAFERNNTISPKPKEIR